MRFASLSGSNTGDYAAAGKAGADAAAKSFAIARKFSPDYGDISKAAMITDAQKFKSAAKASASVAEKGIKAYEDVTKTGQAVAVFNKGQEIKNKQRKAGGLAAIGKIAGAGFLAATDNTKGRERPKADYMGLFEKSKAERTAIKERQKAESDAHGTFSTEPYKPSTGDSPGKVTTGDTNSPTSTPLGSSLTGSQKTVADAIAKYESGDWGYEAFNQGGAKGGTKVLGKSGSYKDTYGSSLTNMSLKDIFHKQNTAQRGLSWDEHFSSGGLHAVGRYQFIGSTLQDEVRRMGLSLDTKFTPQVQDSIWLNHIKRVGDISPWVGPSNEYSSSQKQEFRNMIAGF